MSNGHLTPKLNITYSLLQFFLLGLFLLDFAVLFVRLDYLRVSGGSSYRVGTYCGYQTGKSVRVVGRIAVFKFVSNRVARFDGFTLSFIFTPKGKFNDTSTVSYAYFWLLCNTKTTFKYSALETPCQDTIPSSSISL